MPRSSAMSSCPGESAGARGRASEPPPCSCPDRLSARDFEAGPPARRAPPCRRPNRLGRYPATRDHPRDHRVRVPHLARPKLIATPHRRRDLRNNVKNPPRTIFVVAQAPGALHGFDDIRDVSVPPKTDLVAEDPKSARPAT